MYAILILIVMKILSWRKISNGKMLSLAYSPSCSLYLYDFLYHVEHNIRYKKNIIVFKDIMKNIQQLLSREWKWMWSKTTLNLFDFSCMDKNRSSEYLLLCSSEERTSHRFKTSESRQKCHALVNCPIGGSLLRIALICTCFCYMIKYFNISLNSLFNRELQEQCEMQQTTECCCCFK